MADRQYTDFLKHILKNGVQKGDRTGTGTTSVFGYQMRFDLNQGFPLLTTKQVSFKLVASELLWFLRGDTNIRFLLQHGNHIWDEWAFKTWVESDDYQGPDMTDFGRRAEQDPAFKKQYLQEKKWFCERILADEQFAAKYGELGPVYGKQWRSWQAARGETIDQIAEVIHTIKTNPDSRRLLVVAYNPGEVKSMALPPCHSLFQFYVANGKLSCQLYQRSGDGFLGIPFNIASYALATHLIARECGLGVGEFIHTIGDAHIYDNHHEQVHQQLVREPKELGTLWINPEKTLISEMTMDDLRVEGYDPHPAIKAPVAV